MSNVHFVNGAYRTQVVTGQQRYATEIGKRLTSDYGFQYLSPRRSSASVLESWAWVQTVPLLQRNSALVSLTSRAPVVHPRHVFVVHDLFVLTNPEWYSTAYVRTHRPILRWQLRNAAQIIAVSEPVAREVEKFNRSGLPVRVAPNAPSSIFGIAHDHSAAAGTLRKYGLDAGAYFLVVGSKDPRKNLARVSQAYGNYRQRGGRKGLVVVGSSSKIFRDSIPAWPAGVLETGYVSDSDLATLYAASAGVLFASLAEGFGLPAIEALASGARIAVSDIPVFRWVCELEALYFDPLDVDAISVAMAELEGLDDSQELRYARAKSAGARFHWDDSARIIAEAVRAI